VLSAQWVPGLWCAHELETKYSYFTVDCCIPLPLTCLGWYLSSITSWCHLGSLTAIGCSLCSASKHLLWVQRKRYQLTQQDLTWECWDIVLPASGHPMKPRTAQVPPENNQVRSGFFSKLSFGFVFLGASLQLGTCSWNRQMAFISANVSDWQFLEGGHHKKHQTT
jgi:hypothetical protein